MRRLLRDFSLGSGLLFVVQALAGCSENPLVPQTETPKTFTVTLTSDKDSVISDLADFATLSVRAVSDSGAVKGTVEVKVLQGGLLFVGNPEDGGGAASVDVTLNAQGRGTARLMCTTANGDPQPAGRIRVQATLKPDGGEVTEAVESETVSINCTEAPDTSSLTFITPSSTDVINSPDRVAVQLRAMDANGTPAVAPRVVVVETANNGLKLALTATDVPTNPINTINITPAADGTATFYVLYPGDIATGDTGVPITFTARMINALGRTTTAVPLSFTYLKADNDSAIEFVEAVTNTGLRVEGNASQRIEVDLGAGADETDFVTLSVEVRDRSGQPPPAGSIVKFTCSSAGNVDNCRGLTGIPPEANVDAGATPLDNQTSVLAFTTVEPPSQTIPRSRGLATVTFRPNPNSVVGQVRLGAEFTPTNASPIRVSDGSQALVNFVDANTLVVAVSRSVSEIRSDQSETATLTVDVRKGTNALDNRQVCWVMEEASRSRAHLSDSDDDVAQAAAVTATDPTGKSSVTLSAANTRAQGPVRVQVTVLDQAYSPTLDDNLQTPDQAVTPCQVTDPNIPRTTLVAEVQITRPPILQSLVFVSAEPAILGVVGSSIPSTSELTFRVFNDQNQPQADQAVTFELDVNGDPSATVTPLGYTDANGEVVCFLTAGTQAASLVVRATAVRGEESVSAASDPVSVVGGKPAWAPTHVGAVESYRVFADKSTAGYQDPFGPDARPLHTEIRAQLVDRFSNRVQRASGYQIQWRAETGSIPSSMLTNSDGSATVEYVPGPPFAMDTTPRPFERREWVAYDAPHADTQHEVYRVANPGDGDVTILIATRGEESFVDINGDGAFQRPYADTNSNGRFDGPAEECAPCKPAVACTHIDNVDDPNRATYTPANLDLVETFTDLPEPYVDRNGDGLRANCDLPLAQLPVHHDLARWSRGVGTFCNPYFVDNFESGQISINPETGAPFTPEECRAHWCPDWDPQWNCEDNPRTPARLPATGPITGGRIMWCPNYRYRDISFVSGGRNVPAGSVGMSGIHGIIVADDTPTTGLLETPGALRYTADSPGLLAYRAPGRTNFGTDVQAVIDPVNQQFGVVELTADNGQKLFVKFEPSELPLVDTTASFVVTDGDQRAPFDDFARSQLRIAQTDQFIDGNNNGVWDDVNSCYDTDTLIFKNVTLSGVAFSGRAGLATDLLGVSHFNSYDWRDPGPIINGRLPAGVLALSGYGRYADGPAQVGPIVLYDRLHSFFHVVPDGQEANDPAYPGASIDTVDATDHTGASDYFVHPVDGGSTFIVRFVDVNGNAASPYDSASISVKVQGLGPNTEVTLVSPEAPVLVGGYTAFTLLTPSLEVALPDAGPARISVTVEFETDTRTGYKEKRSLTMQGEVYYRIATP
ncbi:MAG: hypothetical protein AB2A00_00995 [Myxococcota bacterium]